MFDFQLPNFLQESDQNKYVDPLVVFSNCLPMYEVGRDDFRLISKQKLGGFLANDFRNVNDIYNILHPDDVGKVIDFSIQAIDYFNSNQLPLLVCQAEIVFRIKGKGGKLYYYNRRTGVNGHTSKGKISYNYTFMDEISWLKPKAGNWRLQGVNTEYFDFQHPEIATFKGTLSPREVEVLKLLARGFRSNDVAKALFISPHTVRTHRKNMLRKLEVANTPQLIDLTRDMNLY